MQITRESTLDTLINLRVQKPNAANCFNASIQKQNSTVESDAYISVSGLSYTKNITQSYASSK